MRDGVSPDGCSLRKGAFEKAQFRTHKNCIGSDVLEAVALEQNIIGLEDAPRT